MVERLAIVGTGLIGASVGLAARAAGAGEVRGWGVDAEALAAAAEREGVEPAAPLEEGVGGGGLAVGAPPLGAFAGEGAPRPAASGGGATATGVRSPEGP